MHDLLAPVLILLAAGVVSALAARRLGVSPILAYLLAGALIGPHAGGLIHEVHGTETLAEFGIVFMLFVLGLELSLERVRTLRRLIFGLGLAQVLVTGALLALLAWLAGLPAEAAVIVGAGLALSSTAIVLQTLSERGELVARVGRAAIAVLLFQDLAVAPLLALVPILAAGSLAFTTAMALAIGQAVLMLGLIVLIGRYALRHVFAGVAHSRNREAFAALALLIALGTGWATEHVGLSMALGAFLAGILISETEFRHQVEADIEPYRGMLLGLFFITIGMRIEPKVVMDHWPLLFGLVLGVIALKAALIIPMALAFGLPAPVAVRLGLLLGQAGEFAFVLTALAASWGLLDGGTVTLVTVAVTLTMAATPGLDLLGRRLSGRLETRAPVAAPMAEELRDLSGHVVICGFGRVGRLLAALLRRAGVPHVALDLDPTGVAAARREGWPVYFGNAARPEVLHLLKLGEARAVAVTLDQTAAARRIVQALREEHPDLPILVRARDQRHGAELRAAGASNVIPEMTEVALQLGWSVLETVGIGPDEIAHTVEEMRAAETV